MLQLILMTLQRKKLRLGEDISECTFTSLIQPQSRVEIAPVTPKINSQQLIPNFLLVSHRACALPPPASQRNDSRNCSLKKEEKFAIIPVVAEKSTKQFLLIYFPLFLAVVL